jgi:YHS domain-containing protein
VHVPAGLSGWKKNTERVSSAELSSKTVNQGKDVHMEKDPVCGMMVDPTSAAGKSEYKGKTYYFCSAGCKKEFDQDPEKFLKSGATGHMPHQ